MLKFSTLCFLISFNLFPQGKFAYQMSALFPEAHFLGLKYSNTSYTTRNYSCRSRSVVSKYVFEIEVSIKLNGSDFTWDEPIALEYSTPGSESNLVILNEECWVLDSYRLYEFTFIFATNYSTWLNFNIGELDFNGNSIKPNSEYNFSGNSIYIDVNPFISFLNEP